jgi:hypothetical protein
VILLWVKGGCHPEVDGTAGLTSAPEMPRAPRQLRLVPKGEVRGFGERHDLAGVSRRVQRAASAVRILTFLPSSRSTGGFTTARSPALTPSLTSISVPRSRISVILC